VRVPKVLLKCDLVTAAAVILMVVGTLTRLPEIRAWAILIGLFAAGLCIRSAVHEAADTLKVYMRKWSHETFEQGFKAGVEVGREMEAAEKFIAATREVNEG
jgi:hypothetical protein